VAICAYKNNVILVEGVAYLSDHAVGCDSVHDASITNIALSLYDQVAIYPNPF